MGVDSREEKSLRVENLQEIEASHRAGHVATIAGLESAAHLNGLHAELLQWDSVKSRWNVRLANGEETKSLKPDSLSLTSEGRLQAGKKAIVQNSGPEALHDRRCVLVRWGADAGQWLVRLCEDRDAGRPELWLRPSSLRCIHSQDATEGAYF